MIQRTRTALWRVLFSLDHKDVAWAYAFAAAAMLLAAFSMILLVRWQLAFPGRAVPGLANAFDGSHTSLPNGVVSPTFYLQLGAMHGTTMIFLAVVPLLVGAFGSYFVPAMIGAENMALPRINRFGFWAYVTGIVVIYASYLTPGGPTTTGWTTYPPLSIIERHGQSFWLAGMLLVYASSLAISICLIATVLYRRTAGMRLLDLPFFVWSELVSAFLLLLAFPSLAAASVLQLMDRLAGTSFFLPAGLVVDGVALEASGGGSPLLWQHLYWFLAHPEIYVLVLPAFGIVAEVISTHARRPLWGYRSTVAALAFLGAMSMLVWAHHMYLTGMGAAMSSFFQATTVIISLPSVVIVTSLVATLWGGSIRFSPPMLFALAFLPMFGLGGLLGLPLAYAPSNVLLHDTNYVVGHFHYIAAPGTLFALFAGIYHWFPLWTGKILDPKLAQWHFWPSLVAMNGVFVPMLFHGLAGVSRRLYDGGSGYAHGSEIHWLHVVSTVSAFVLLVAQLPFFWNVVRTLATQQRATSNPWNAGTYEWRAPDTAA